MWEYDPYHSSIITAGNGGTKPTQAAFTIFYIQGTQRYDLEQTLQPDEQMWIDVGKLIREQLPDKNGKALPADLTSGSYEFSDLTNTGVGTLFEGKVIYDKTHGHVAYGCAACCGYDFLNATLMYDPLGVPVGGPAGQGVIAPDMCQGGALADVSDIFWGAWSTASSSIATVDTHGTHTGVAVGSTTSQTRGCLNDNDPRLNCPRKCTTPSGNDNVMKLSCPASVTRAGSATCSVSSAPTGATFSGWKFTDANSNTVTSGNTASSWSGAMVTNGTVSVTVSAGGNSTPLSAGISVNNRNWHTSPASPAEVSNGTFLALPVPPAQSGNDSGLGASAYQLTDTGFSITTIGDSGPNSGYSYYASALNFSVSYYQYEINPDLENSNSTFSQHQSGTNGFISWSNLLAQTRRHEYNSTTQSHYAFYSNSLGTNNPGDYFESRVAPPPTNLSTFNSDTRSGINSRYTTITVNTSVEPYAVNYSETGVPLGNVCYSPYTACP
jgi:hypothetical protein